MFGWKEILLCTEIRNWTKNKDCFGVYRYLLTLPFLGSNFQSYLPNSMIFKNGIRQVAFFPGKIFLLFSLSLLALKTAPACLAFAPMNISSILATKDNTSTNQ